MKKLIVVLMLLCATVALADVQIKDEDSKGVPTFVTGDLGKLSDKSDKAAKDFLKAQKHLLPFTGNEDFDATSSSKDNLSQTHIKFQQKIRGLRVVGAEYIVHADANGNVFAMNGRFVADKDLPRNPAVDAWTAIETAVAEAGIVNPSYGPGKPELLYVVNERSNAYLAFSMVVKHTNEQGRNVDTIYANASDGHLLFTDSDVKHAKNRRTYTANNTFNIPGTLVLTETTGSTSDVTLQKAHDYAGVVYDYYWNVHSRDSYNGAGATLTSTVHYGSAYNNAGWTGTQMVYGDGDGTQFGPFSRSLDVVAHELTHAVTDSTADLVYSNESGALNEASSDILGVAAESWSYGSVSSLTWKMGEDCYTPATAGDALRYMNDPAAAGDNDYYPTRYTGTADNGGVHSNSGIANLAFYMMVMGGTHPRGKTTVSVPALSATASTSLNMGAKIWYRALTVYMTSSTNFQGARTATAQAATDLYGAAAADSVHKAWDAVAVPGTPGGGGGTTTLTNGVAVTGISAPTGTWTHYKINVPSGQSQLKVEQSGGTGDADLYVKFGSQPTSASYTCRPYLSGNTETCTQTSPAAGDWYISIYSYSTFSGVSLKATYSAAAGCTSVSGSLSGTGANWYSAQYTSSISGTHTGKLTGPAGPDFDLYLQKWNGSAWASVASGTGSTATENVTYSGTSGTYRWRVYAYSGSGSFTLCTTKP